MGDGRLTRGCGRQSLQWMLVLQLLLEFLRRDTLRALLPMLSGLVSESSNLSTSPCSVCAGGLIHAETGLGLGVHHSMGRPMRLRKPRRKLQGLLERVEAGGGGKGCARAAVQTWQVCVVMGAALPCWAPNALPFGRNDLRQGHIRNG